MVLWKAPLYNNGSVCEKPEISEDRVKIGQIFIIAAEERYQYGDIIYNEGNSGDWVYVILSGSVELSKTVQGHKYIIEVLKPGDIFGAIEFVGGLKRTTTARSIGDTIIGVIDREFIDNEYNQLSQQFRSILGSLIIRNRCLLDRACSFREREEPRAQRILNVTYKDRESFMSAYSVNVSAGGLFIQTDNFLQPGNRFILGLQLPDIPNRLQINCEVIWARKRDNSQPTQVPGMGVKFLKISKTDHQTLEKFLEENRARS